MEKDCDHTDAHTVTQWVVSQCLVICRMVSMCQFLLEVTMTAMLFNRTGGTSEHINPLLAVRNL